MAYELPPLPYDYNALEPFIDTETMKLHHDKHHQAYINNVNAALANHPALAAKSVDDLISVGSGIGVRFRAPGGIIGELSRVREIGCREARDGDKPEVERPHH